MLDLYIINLPLETLNFFRKISQITLKYTQQAVVIIVKLYKQILSNSYFLGI
ncbi:hypothetical protein ALT721_1110004 [Alteromonas alvinellae]